MECPYPTDVAGFNPEDQAGDCLYDPAAADRAVEFIEKYLFHFEGRSAGQRFILQPWQRDFVKTLFGWQRPDGTRRFTEAILLTPRKMGKSTLAAAVLLYVTYCDGLERDGVWIPEAAGQSYIAATNREQAGLMFRIASHFVRASPELMGRTKIIDSTKTMTIGDTLLRAVPSDERSAHGQNANVVMCDELHAWPYRTLFDVLKTGTANRAQPIVLSVSTSGHDRNSLCFVKYEYGSRVRDNAIEDPSFLPCIYKAEDNADWREPKTWYEANPNLGVTVTEEYLREQCQRALNEPSFEATFRQLHLNQWTASSEAWLDLFEWKAAADAEAFDPQAPTYAGLDLSNNIDLTAWCLVQRRPAGGWRCRWHFWIAKERLEKLERVDRVPYSQWVRDGWITATPGSEIDYGFVEQRILEDAHQYDLRHVGFDPANAMQLRSRMEGEGVSMVKIIQGFSSISEPSKELERRLIGGTMSHDGNPVAEWCAANVERRINDRGDIRPVKPVKGGGAKKIDGIVALIMAIHVGLMEEPVFRSKYESEAPRFF